mgnify:CR=1 FL=1
MKYMVEADMQIKALVGIKAESLDEARKIMQEICFDSMGE